MQVICERFLQQFASLSLINCIANFATFWRIRLEADFH